MKRRVSILFHQLSSHASDRGLDKIPGAETVYQYLSNVVAPQPNTRFEWISYEGFALKVAPGDHVSDVLIQKGEYEPRIRESLHKYICEGDTAVDIGAHIGSHTLSMRAACGDSGQVIAYEPHPRNAQYVRDTIRENGFENVSVIEAGLSNDDGVAELVVDDNNTGSSFLQSDREQNQNAVEVSIKSADDDLQSKVSSDIDIAKIDIQGGEYDLLIGNDAIFDLVENMVVEIHAGSFLSPPKAGAVFDVLDDRGSIRSL